MKIQFVLGLIILVVLMGCQNDSVDAPTESFESAAVANSNESNNYPPTPSVKPRGLGQHPAEVAVQTKWSVENVDDFMRDTVEAYDKGLLSENLYGLGLSDEDIKFAREDFEILDAKFGQETDGLSRRVYLNRGNCKIYAAYDTGEYRKMPWEEAEITHLVGLTFRQCERNRS